PGGPGWPTPTAHERYPQHGQSVRLGTAGACTQGAGYRTRGLECGTEHRWTHPASDRGERPAGAGPEVAGRTGKARRKPDAKPPAAGHGPDAELAVPARRYAARGVEQPRGHARRGYPLPSRSSRTAGG